MKPMNLNIIPSLFFAKQLGYSDDQLAVILNKNVQDIYDFRLNEGIVPTYKIVDTCAGEFEAKHLITIPVIKPLMKFVILIRKR